MSRVVDELITKVSMDADGYRRGVDQVTAATRAMQGAVRVSLGGVAEIARRLAQIGAAAGAGVVGLAWYASRQSAETERLRASLIAVAGSAAEAEAQFQRLRQVAKLPGLGLNEAIEMSVSLQSAGMSAQTAERAIRAFGNALASVGRGREALDTVNLALTKMMSTGRVTQQDINQISNALPQFRQLMQQAFGTASLDSLRGMDPGEFILGIVSAAERLPAVAETASNAWSNLRDSIAQAASQVGDGINRILTPAVSQFGAIVERLLESGWFARLGEEIAAMFDVERVREGVVNIAAFLMTLSEQGVETMRRIGSGIVQQADAIRDAMIKVAAVMAGVFLAGPIIRGVVGLIKAFQALRAAIAAAGVASVVMEAVATGGASLVKAAVGLAAGAAAAAGIYAALDRIIPRIDESSFSRLPGIGEFTQAFEANKAKISELIQIPNQTQPASEPQAQSQALRLAERTADASERMVQLQSQLVNMQRAVFGGGELARMGVAPAEIGGGRAQRALASAIELMIREQIAAASAIYVARARA